MGYNTLYKIETYPDVFTAKAQEYAQENHYWWDGEPVKWYDFEDDMKVFSKDNPQLIVIISGQGEDRGDIWKLAMCKGKTVWRYKLPKVELPDVPEEVKDMVSPYARTIESALSKLTESEKKALGLGK